MLKLEYMLIILAFILSLQTLTADAYGQTTNTYEAESISIVEVLPQSELTR